MIAHQRHATDRCAAAYAGHGFELKPLKNLPSIAENQTVAAMGDAESRYSSSSAMSWEEAKPGIFTKLLFQNESRSERTLLVRLDPGARSAPHSHTEFEQIYVIEGSFEDGERVLSAGDFCCRSPGQVHTAYCRDGALVLVTYLSSLQS